MPVTASRNQASSCARGEKTRKKPVSSCAQACAECLRHSSLEDSMSPPLVRPEFLPLALALVLDSQPR